MQIIQSSDNHQKEIAISLCQLCNSHEKICLRTCIYTHIFTYKQHPFKYNYIEICIQ